MDLIERVEACGRGSRLWLAVALTALAGSAQATVTPSGVTVPGTEGSPIANAVVATFTTSDQGPPAVSSFTATIDWGDGSAATPATITSPSSGTYNVIGSHTYADEGTFSVVVVITDSTDATNATANSTASIAEGDFGVLLPITFSVMLGAAYNGPVGSFTDPGNPLQVVSDFTATIDWGDGATTAGTLSGSTGGPFTISGSHTYSAAGVFPVKATFSDDPPSILSATINSTATVVGPPTLSKSFGAATVQQYQGTSLQFVVANPNTTASLTGVGFTDTLPAGLVVSTPSGLTGSCGGGSITAVAGSSVVSLSGATLAAEAQCSFAVNVTATVLGPLQNVTGNVGSTEGGVGETASATLEVAPPIPTLSTLGLIALLGALGAAGFLLLRRRVLG